MKFIDYLVKWIVGTPLIVVSLLVMAFSPFLGIFLFILFLHVISESNE